MSIAFPSPTAFALSQSARTRRILSAGGRLLMMCAFVSVLLPSLALAAAAIDLSRANALRHDMQNAVRATVLAAASDEFVNDATLTGTMARLYAAEGGDLSSLGGFNVQSRRYANGVSIEVRAQLPTRLLPLIGIETLPVSIVASAAPIKL